MLTANVPEAHPPTGARGKIVKPITEGKAVAVNEPGKKRSSIWGALDVLGTSVVNGISDVASATAQREANRISGDTTGDPADQSGGVRNSGDGMAFYEKYKTELMIGGGLIAAALVISLVRR